MARQLVDGRDIEISIDRQSKRARNWRCCHHQEVGVSALADELLALAHPKFMLLIDDYQTEVFHRKGPTQQRVSPNDQRRNDFRTAVLPQWIFQARSSRLQAARLQFNWNAQRL